MEVGERRLYLENIQVGNRPGLTDPLFTHSLQQWLILLRIPFHDSCFTEPAHDPGRGFEGAEHDRHSSVFIDVGDCLAAGAGGVDIGDMVGGEDCEGRGGETFRGYVDVCCEMVKKKG